MGENENRPEEKEKLLFAIYAEKKEYPKPLIQMDLSFQQLISNIVFPYGNKIPFFIDGVPLKTEDLDKIKILQQQKDFPWHINQLYHNLASGETAIRKIYGEQYHVRLEAALRMGSIDVTSEIIMAFDKEIKPKIKDKIKSIDEFLKDHSGLISTALQFYNLLAPK